VKLTAVPSIPYLTYPDHQIYQFLYAKQPLAELLLDFRFLLIRLIYCLNKEPILIEYLLIIRVDPKVVTHHHAFEELFLKDLNITNVEANVS
jgi:hypothetical protein